MTISAAGSGRMEVQNGWYCPEFNRRLNCRVMSLRAENAELPAKLGWLLQLNSA
jgi:hypothetical protein